MFKDRWIQKEGFLATKDNDKHNNGAIIYVDDHEHGANEEVLTTQVARWLGDRSVFMVSTGSSRSNDIDKSKAVAEEFIEQLMKIDSQGE